MLVISWINKATVNNPGSFFSPFFLHVCVSPMFVLCGRVRHLLEHYIPVWISLHVLSVCGLPASCCDKIPTAWKVLTERLNSAQERERPESWWMWCRSQIHRSPVSHCELTEMKHLNIYISFFFRDPMPRFVCNMSSSKKCLRMLNWSHGRINIVLWWACQIHIVLYSCETSEYAETDSCTVISSGHHPTTTANPIDQLLFGPVYQLNRPRTNTEWQTVWETFCRARLDFSYFWNKLV